MLDSGLFDIASLPIVNLLLATLPPDMVAAARSSLPFDSLASAARVRCPVLAFHSAADEIVPAEQARRFIAACCSADKTLELLDRSGHNDVWLHHGARLDRLLSSFASRVLADPPAPPLGAAELSRLSVRELRERAQLRGISMLGCSEKADLVNLLL